MQHHRLSRTLYDQPDRLTRREIYIYVCSNTKTSQVGGHATRIAELVRREFSIKFPVSRGETEIRGTLVPINRGLRFLPSFHVYQCIYGIRDEIKFSIEKCSRCVMR